MKQKLIISGTYWVVMLTFVIAIALQRDQSSSESSWMLLRVAAVVYLIAIAIDRIRIKRKSE